MTFCEAIAEAQKGKRIYREGEPGRYAIWRPIGLYWEGECSDEAAVRVCAYNVLCQWFAEKPPPKQYDFAEAYAMMKAGKWMKSACTHHRYSFGGTFWRTVSFELSTVTATVGIKFTDSEIDSKWIEVTP